MNPSDIEKYTLVDIECEGCGKTITIAIPFNGIKLCSECLKKE
jgi:hypothetical protein